MSLAPRPGALRVEIAAVAAHLPSRVVHNDELAAVLDTTDEWIRTRTGMVVRHWAAPDEATSDLAIAAAAKALADAGVAGRDLAAVIVCTTTPDHQMPGTAPIVAAALDAPQATAFDVQAACTGWLHGLEVGASLVAARQQPVLVIGAEVLTRFIDMTDRTTAVLFGDGAGAAVLTPSDRPTIGPFTAGSDGELLDLLWFESGGSRTPATVANINAGRQFLTMRGGDVYRHAVARMAEASGDVLALAGLTIADVDLVVAHQANARIIEAMARRVGASPEQVHVTVAKHGNTSAASIPLALEDAASTGRLRPGDTILLTAFGGGLTWGAGLVTWSR